MVWCPRWPAGSPAVLGDQSKRDVAHAGPLECLGGGVLDQKLARDAAAEQYCIVAAERSHIRGHLRGGEARACQLVRHEPCARSGHSEAIGMNLRLGDRGISRLVGWRSLARVDGGSVEQRRAKVVDPVAVRREYRVSGWSIRLMDCRENTAGGAEQCAEAR